MKKFVYIFISIFFIFVCISACRSADNTKHSSNEYSYPLGRISIDEFSFSIEQRKEPRVYITATGECYHSWNCSYLGYSKIEIGKYEAIAEGYRACSRCGGISNGYIYYYD